MELNVAYSSDENYFQHLKISLISLLDNNRQCSKINIYILSNGISDKSLQNLQKTIIHFDVNVELIVINFAKILGKMQTELKFNHSAFGRLFLDECIDKDRVLYLDCDSAINGSFLELFKMDLGEKICAAVQDNVYKKYKTSIGLKKDDVYFNSGFVLFDLKKWRNEKMQEKAIEMIESFNGNIPHNDQGVLNSICYKRILRLHPKYNLQCPMFEYTPEQINKMVPNYYSKREKNKPYIGYDLII